VAQVGAVRKATVYLAGIAHANTGHLDIQLASPGLRVRDLSSDNGSTANYSQTFFDDAAATLITAGVVPYTGRFRPEQSLTTTSGLDFRSLGAAGTWRLQIRDDTSGTAGTLNGWALALCVDPAANYCGDAVPSAADGEECDDGNAVDNDACSNLCQITDGCGDGNLDLGEECDDNNILNGDGCSGLCVLDIACGAGEMPVILRNTTQVAIPDNNLNGMISPPISVPVSGVVRRVITSVNITHTQDSDLDLWLMSPFGIQRNLSDENGSTNDHYRMTLFSDSASTLITAGVAPYTGTFIPEETISSAAGFGNQSAGGNWVLRIADDAGAGQVGTLDGWSLALCVDTAVASVCGNGWVEATEQCDDGNVAAGDGCSNTCQLELGCGAGQTPVIIRSSPGLIIPDTNTTGVTDTIMVMQAGTVRKAVVALTTIAHSFDADLDFTLTSPMGTNVDVCSDNGSSDDHYVSTTLDDAGAAVLPTTTGLGPFRGRWRPDVALGGAMGVNGQPSAGNWSLKAVDDLGGDTGVLRSWTLGLCVE
jgi:cysteine-rich repeat protein